MYGCVDAACASGRVFCLLCRLYRRAVEYSTPQGPGGPEEAGRVGPFPLAREPDDLQDHPRDNGHGELDLGRACCCLKFWLLGWVDWFAD